jgi:hypothetical protein
LRESRSIRREVDLLFRELYFVPVTHEPVMIAIRSTGKINFLDTMTYLF